MASKVISSELRGLLVKRLYATKSAPATKVEHVEKISLAKQDAKTTTLPSGLIVASIENYSPVSRIGVMVKAGPRYEPANQLGISHCLRNCLGTATQKTSQFGIVRNIEYVGGNLHASSSRETLFYELNCNRDHLDDCIRYLAQSLTESLFEPWELKQYQHRLKLESASWKSDPVAVLTEALHKASFQGGLRNSLCSPDFMIGQHSTTMVRDYLKQTFTTDHTAIVGLGVDHDQLVEHVNKHFKLQGASRSNLGASKYKGGDLLIDSCSPITFAAVVAEGSGLKNQKDFLCLSLLHNLLGEGPRIKYSSSGASKLGAVVSKATSNPFAVSGLNISYSDTGLFGFVVAGHPEDMDKIVKGLVAEMKTLKKATAQDIATAKQRLKASMLMSLESQSDLLEEMALNALTTGQLVTASDLVKAIDAITLQDVTAVATKVLKGKPALAAVGQLQKTPYLEDLIV